MLRKLLLPVLAGVLLVFSVGYAIYVQRPEPDTPPPVSPPTTPFGHTVAGAGMVEPSNEASTNSWVSVGSQLSGVVVKVPIHIGQIVQAGDLLFELDKRAIQAELQAREASVLAAQEQLRRLELQPRPEEVPPSEAQVEAAEATMQQTRDQRDRDRKLIEKGGVSEEEVVRAEQSFRTSRAQHNVARANLALLKAGAWEPDKAIAAANLELARAQLEQTKTTLALQEIRAPSAGTILQINIRPGEFVSTNGSQSLVLMGNLDPMHVRVNIDEEDIPRLRLNAPARAKIRGDTSQEEVPLKFVRLEPYIVPKTSLTGINVERVDTRVVQLIYAISPDQKLVREKKILVGQLLDVFIDTSVGGQQDLRTRPSASRR